MQPTHRYHFHTPDLHLPRRQVRKHVPRHPSLRRPDTQQKLTTPVALASSQRHVKVAVHRVIVVFCHARRPLNLFQVCFSRLYAALGAASLLPI